MTDEKNQQDSDRGSEADPIVRRPSLDIMKHLRGYFFAGVLITAPIGLTFYFAWLFIHWVDSHVNSLIPEAYNPETYLPFTIPGLGLVMVFVVLTLVGALTAGILGRIWVRTTERVMDKMPVIRGVYKAIKQIFETVLAKKSQAFRSVVLLEYPRRGIWVLGLISGRTEGEIQATIDDEVLNVFVPTTPNPTSGFLLFVPRKDLTFLDMTIEEGIKMVVSGGIVTPPYLRSAKSAGAPGPISLPASARVPEPTRVD